MNLALDLPSTASSDFSEATASTSLDDLRFSPREASPTVVDQRLNAFRPNRHPVLQQLRSQYPTGCLSADLVQVNSDQFVVRANVQVEGVTIVTALASATTVEVAEDRARSRALEALGLNVSHSAVSSSLSATLPMMPEIAPELTIPPVMQPASEPAEKALPRTATKRKTKAQPVEPVSEMPTLELTTLELTIAAPVEEIANAVVEPEVIAAPEVVVESKVVVEPEVVAEPEVIAEAETIAEPEAVAAPEVIAAPIVETPIVEVEESFEISYESEEVYEYTFEEPEAAPIVETPAPVKAPIAAPVAIDLSDTIAQIGMEIDRIGWTKKQGSAYLQQEYSKRTRAELTEAELFSFLGYLKSLPAKLQPELSQIPF
jgi:hypothetical protein